MAAASEKHKAQMKAWHDAHRDEHRAAMAAQYQTNRAVRDAQAKAYRRAHPEIHRAIRFADNANQRARRFGLPGRLRARDMLELDGPCAYCGAPASGSFDHVRPMFLGGANELRNVVPSCRACNYSKGRKRLPAAEERAVLARYHGPRRQPGSALPSRRPRTKERT